jgi:hypoxanthine-guanine phosphoribosyltransferase
MAFSSFYENLDVDYWRHPQGVTVALDRLKFLFIPDSVESMIVADLANSVYAYQVKHQNDGRQIAKAVMITMGGLLPGVLLHDHLAWNPDKRIPAVEFGTLGVQCYAGPGQPLAEPRIIQDLTIDVHDQVVAVVEDLVDLGGTARFVAQYLVSKGARGALLIAPYLKNTSLMSEMDVISFGVVPPDTWIITPRERVETLIKRVPYWRERGASLADCDANLTAIGYPRYLIEQYLELAFNQ